MINYVDKMADALVDVLKYSNQDVEWVEPDDMKPNDGVQPEWFYPAIENAEYSEITAILQYTQQEAVFEDEIGELMLGIALVEMKHYAHIRDAIVALGGTLPKPYDSKNVNIGETPGRSAHPRRAFGSGHYRVLQVGEGTNYRKYTNRRHCPQAADKTDCGRKPSPQTAYPATEGHGR